MGTWRGRRWCSAGARGGVTMSMEAAVSASRPRDVLLVDCLSADLVLWRGAGADRRVIRDCSGTHAWD